MRGVSVIVKTQKGSCARLGRAAFVFLFVALAAQANTMVFQTAPNATLLNFPINDRVTFITGLNTVEIQIQNLQTSADVDTQAVAAIDWLVNGFANAQPTSVTLLTSANSTETGLGQVVNITGSGAGGYTLSSLTTITNRWKLAATSAISGGSEINVFNGGQPNQLIIGPPTYSPNSSITNHNPFLETDSNTHISFLMTYDASVGITAASTINSQTGFRPVLDFGTTLTGTQQVELIPELPEPSPVLLSLSGLILLVAARRYRRRST
jgi:hypothetical protein